MMNNMNDDIPEANARSQDRGIIQDILIFMVGKVKESPMMLAGGAFVIGWIIGLVVFGWGLWPVEYVDAHPVELSGTYRQEYLIMALEAYQYNQNPVTTNERIEGLGEFAPELLQQVIQNPPDGALRTSAETFARLYAVEGGVDVGDPADPVADLGAEDAAEDGTGFNKIFLYCGIGSLLLVAVAVWFFLRGRGGERGPRSTHSIAQQFSREVEQTDYEAMGEDPPIAQWVTTYLVGDDLFDDSYSIDLPSTGEFMGECGVGIADTIGVGEPKRVSAFEVWLFDKNDIQTVTKVIMSDYIFNDDAAHGRLVAKGEPVLSQPGIMLGLETETLYMTVRVLDMNYGTGALPDNSFFERLTLELAVWTKKV